MVLITFEMNVSFTKEEFQYQREVESQWEVYTGSVGGVYTELMKSGRGDERTPPSRVLLP